MAKHKYIETPEILYQLFEKYKEWAKENKISLNVLSGKGEVIEVSQDRPTTWEDFECYLSDNDIINRLEDYRNNHEYKEYSVIITRIDKEIFNQLFAGASIGRYKENLIARKLGIADKKEVDQKTTKMGKIIRPKRDE